jgi:hypothetical protein
MYAGGRSKYDLPAFDKDTLCYILIADGQGSRSLALPQMFQNIRQRSGLNIP